MRFLIYFIFLAMLAFTGVTIFQVMLKRMANRDRVRASQLQKVIENLTVVIAQLEEIENYCDNAAIVNPNDLTALNVLNMLRKGVMHDNHNKENA